MTVIGTRRAIEALPNYSVLVAVDDDTDVRVKDSSGTWTVSRRFTGPRADTLTWAAMVGFRLLHTPGGQG